MGRYLTRYSHFTFKVIECHKSVSFMVHDAAAYHGNYYLTFRTDKLLCESISASKKLDMPLRLNLSCDDRPQITMEDVEKRVRNEVSDQDFSTFQQREKTCSKLMKDYQPKGIGQMRKEGGIMQGVVLLESDVWMATHVLLCSGKDCFVSLSAYREYRQRDYTITSVGISTELEE